MLRSHSRYLDRSSSPKWASGDTQGASARAIGPCCEKKITVTSINVDTIRQGDRLPGFGQRLEGCRNPTLRWILYGFDKNFGKKLDEARTTWNQKIREYYRDVLSLNTKYAPIRTTYMPDDNGVFIRLIDKEYPDLDFAELVALKRYVGEAEKVL